MSPQEETASEIHRNFVNKFLPGLSALIDGWVEIFAAEDHDPLIDFSKEVDDLMTNNVHLYRSNDKQKA